MTALRHTVSIPLSVALFSGVIPAQCAVRFDPSRGAWIIAPLSGPPPASAETSGTPRRAEPPAFARRIRRSLWRGLFGGLLGLAIGAAVYQIAPALGLAVDVAEPFPVDTGQSAA